MAGRPGSGIERLTGREQEVARLMARGLTNGEIANELGIGFSTAKTHVSQVIAKLGVATREEAVREWRARHRFSRWVRGIAGGLSVGTAAKVGGAVAAAGAVVIGVAIVASPGSDSAPANSVADSSPTAQGNAAPTPTRQGNAAPTLELRILEVNADSIDTSIRIAFADSAGFGFDQVVRVSHASVRNGAGERIESYFTYPEKTGDLSAELLFPALDPGTEWELTVTSASADGSRIASPPGGWSVPLSVPEWPADSTVEAPGIAQPFGHWTVVIDEVAKSGDRFVVRAHLEGVDQYPPLAPNGAPMEPPWLRLQLPDGSFAAMDWGRIFHGPDHAGIDAAFYDVDEWPAQFHIEYPSGVGAAISSTSRAVAISSPINQIVDWDGTQVPRDTPFAGAALPRRPASATFDLAR
jgi:DNA-binding CsgD family transcriptional regulator